MHVHTSHNYLQSIILATTSHSPNTHARYRVAKSRSDRAGLESRSPAAVVAVVSWLGRRWEGGLGLPHTRAVACCKSKPGCDGLANFPLADLDHPLNNLSSKTQRQSRGIVWVGFFGLELSKLDFWNWDWRFRDRLAIIETYPQKQP